MRLLEGFSVAVGNPVRFFYRYPTDPSIIGKELVPSPDAAGVIRGQLSRAIFDTHSPVDGVERIAAHCRVGNEPIVIINGIDKQLALKAWNAETSFISVIAFCLFILYISFSRFFFLTTKRLESYQEKLAINLKTSALGQLAGEIAHEVNSPLTTIQLNTSQLKRLLQTETIDRSLCLGKVETTLKTVDKIAKIVGGIKNATRNGDNDAPEILSVSKAIEECLVVSRERIKSVGIDLQFENKAEGEHVLCRRVQVGQVLLNLVGNAVDAVENQSEKWIRIETTVAQEYVEISVLDSGPGIDRAVASSLFQPFVTSKVNGKGNGLGLSISKSLIEAQGGRLYLNRQRKNTCFTIQLPQHQVKPSPNLASG